METLPQIYKEDVRVVVSESNFERPATTIVGKPMLSKSSPIKKIVHRHSN